MTHYAIPGLNAEDRQAERDYNCDKPDCPYCVLLGYIPKVPKKEPKPQAQPAIPWTESEKAYLRKNYHHLSMIQLCAEMKRCRRTIYQQATKLGLGTKTRIHEDNTRYKERRSVHSVEDNYGGWF